MRELLTLGKLYVSDFHKLGEKPRGGKIELKLVLGEYGEARLERVAPLDTMYGKYWYRSGINATMKKALSDVVASIISRFKTKESDVWLDIACNDGTLLGLVPDYMYKIGVDPADDSFREQSEKVADVVIQDYFTYEKYCIKAPRKAKIITAIAVFYDIENREKFLTDIYNVMEENGLMVMQLSYTPLMIKQLAFDNICHEHVFYYSLDSINQLLNKYGFTIMDCSLNDINGGSFRLYIMKKTSDKALFGSMAHRDVCDVRIKSLLQYENSMFLDSPRTWSIFFDRIEKLKEDTLNIIKGEVAKGKTVMAYGASTKGNTLLQYFGLDNSLITAIADRNPQKWGLVTVGTNIPIISEEEMRIKQPDYLLILPWHFIDEFYERELDYIRKGGKFIVPCPSLRIMQ